MKDINDPETFICQFCPCKKTWLDEQLWSHFENIMKSKSYY